MKVERVYETCARFDDGTCWSLPTDALQWIARYGSVDALARDRYLIAQALDCYAELVRLPIRQRNRRVTALRRAMVSRDAIARLASEGVNLAE